MTLSENVDGRDTFAGLEGIAKGHFVGNSTFPGADLIMYLLNLHRYNRVCVYLCLMFAGFSATSLVRHRCRNAHFSVFPLLFVASLSRFSAFYHSILSLGFSCFALKEAEKKRFVRSALFLSLSIACDRSAVQVLPVIILYLFNEFFKAITNPATDPQIVCKWYGLKLITLLSAPIIVFVGFVAGDLCLRGTYAGAPYGNYPFLFQTSLRGFYFGKSFFSDDYQGREIGLEATDKYVLDRSLVRILNMKHKKLIFSEPLARKREKDIGLAAEYEIEIKKVYMDAETSHKSHFITSDDIVKLLVPGTENALGVPETNQDAKLLDVKFGIFSDERDFWVVECDGKLKARESIFKLRHYRTGLMLGCHFGGSLEMHASVYSDHRSRVFMIVNNKNAPFFTSKSHEKSYSEKVVYFPPVTFSAAIKEHAWQLLRAKPDDSSNSELLQSRIFLTNIIISLFICALMLLLRYLRFPYTRRMLAYTHMPCNSLFFMWTLCHWIIFRDSLLPCFAFSFIFNWTTLSSAIDFSLQWVHIKK